jgi:ribonuclease P protein component
MKDFDNLFKVGRFVGGDLAMMKVWKINEEKFPNREYKKDDLKIAFVVSTKVHKSAVKRNRLKRQMREVVRLLIKDNKVKSGFMVAIMAKKEMLGKEYSDIEKSLTQLLERAKLI